MIRVINVRGIYSPEERQKVAYVGRGCNGWTGHPLANPFKVERMDDRDICLTAYRNWLESRPTFDADLAALWEQTDHGRLPLGCWCAPLGCHADILAELLTERYGNG